MKTSKQLLDSCQAKLNLLEKMIPLKIYQNRLLEIDALVSRGDFWSDAKAAAALMKERQKLSDLSTKMSEYQTQIQYYTECAEMLPEELETSAEQLSDLETHMDKFEFQQILSDPIDNNAAILSISAGAGGLEAANWVTMLNRMYCRYADAQKFSIEILDMKESEEHSAMCTDAASFRISGPFAYGLLKGETGVHRLIRNSPFSSSDARHTSFAAVQVTPDIEDTIEIKIDEERDLEITTMRGSGCGGQNVNRRESAVRVKHFPSGLVINSRSERDQHSNRKIAMKMLKSKLYDLEIQKKKNKQEASFNALNDVSFGHQIRSYIMSPQALVKDHRSEHEIANTESVLDGNIDELLLAYLRSCFRF
jgi:peptide chain release factor 2